MPPTKSPGRTTAAEMKAYAARWKLVAAFEIEELRATSIEKKFSQLCGLIAFAKELGWETTDQSEVDEVRARWNRLHAIYRHG